ncbi:MAG: hypothetical protein CVU48_06355 [Candidatus Cloacimonetes bacterium HGW-Cloacimonetes-1]|jgi:protein involved in polysaccharide export with SLBB domain|nr:MAG: hypothetical protein CVU48_06355 [Candidatus Cloacimonetes bacterium HGW-Cloacimonetes-1]
MKTKSIGLLLLILAIFASVYAIEIPQMPTTIPIGVSITGYLSKPGVYRLSTMDRLSDAVEIAQQSGKPDRVINKLQSTPLDETENTQVFSYALRSVVLMRQGKRNVYDLEKFYKFGDISQNPLLKDDDIIIISPIQQTISIQGSVFSPGEYEFVQGDKLSDVIKFANGFEPEANLSNVMLYRYKSNMKDYDIISFDLSSYPSNPSIADIPLHSTDRIMVQLNQNYRIYRSVTVEGNVMAPGKYLINESTTLYDVLMLCGGPTDQADLSNGIVVNGVLNLKPSPEIERLIGLPMASMTPIEYTYLRATLRQLKGKYSVDMLNTWESQGSRDNPHLVDGDHIFIPEKVEMVCVSGQVVRPGLIPWVEGENYEYYIAAAGGYTGNRRLFGTRVINSNSGNWAKPSRKDAVNSGDIVFVPERIDYGIWYNVKDTVSFSYQLIAIFVSIQALRK